MLVVIQISGQTDTGVNRSFRFRAIKIARTAQTPNKEGGDGRQVPNGLLP